MQCLSIVRTCPKIVKILEELNKKAMEIITHWNDKDRFEIKSSFGSRFKVHLGDKQYSCRKWELTGIPCAHAIYGMFYLGYQPEEYVHDCYKKETFIRAYSNLMGVVNSCDMWLRIDTASLKPQIRERLPGRPKKHDRKKDKSEKTKTNQERLGKKRSYNDMLYVS